MLCPNPGLCCVTSSLAPQQRSVIFLPEKKAPCSVVALRPSRDPVFQSPSSCPAGRGSRPVSSFIRQVPGVRLLSVVTIQSSNLQADRTDSNIAYHNTGLLTVSQ
eukprot:GFUD01064769.1.p1 GENE.GFUD01064769.1~~GFUD01064769.1.p1  ORF type:complete len:105 (+),score=11.74 GFUD01064769.1:561-875(+)